MSNHFDCSETIEYSGPLSMEQIAGEGRDIGRIAHFDRRKYPIRSKLWTRTWSVARSRGRTCHLRRRRGQQLQSELIAHGIYNCQDWFWVDFRSDPCQS